LEHKTYTGYAFQNEDGYFQGPFLEEINHISAASIHKNLKGVQKDRIHRIVEVEYEWVNGTCSFIREIKDVRR